MTFSETSVTVHPGQTQQITAHITPPSSIDPSILPVFSGFVQVESATETFHVTYLGVGAALKDAQVVDNTNTFLGVDLPVLTDPAGTFFTNATNFTFVGDDVPQLLVRLDFGTPLLRADLVDPNEKIPTTLNKRSGMSFPQDITSGTFAQIKTVGTIFELDFQPRNTDMDDGTGFTVFELDTPTFANGTTIPNGTYKLLLRALKVTGDPTNEADFESWLSPIIGVDVPSSS